MDPQEIIKLNVGGHEYMTTIGTLTTRESDCLLANMFKYPNPAARLPQDPVAYFIDRDGFLFRFLLNYLRDGELPKGLEDDEVLTEGLMREADYFGMFELRDEIERRRNLAKCRRDLWSPEEGSCCKRCGDARMKRRNFSAADDPLCAGDDDGDGLLHPALFMTIPDF